MPRLAVVEREKCSPIECGNYLCMRFCPVNRTGKECILIGQDRKVNIDEKLCTGCGICVKKCPFGALHIINLPEEIAKQPIHQFGKNGFRLYNLPMPLFGRVVGVLGKNGIGKTTAIKILAQALKPNMGFEKEAGISELIGFFKGSEAQKFFEMVRDGEIKVSYKPQAVDLIPRSAKGKVSALLRKVDERKRFDEIVTELELNSVLENDISEVSGGELQRVAIAAALLRDANVYIFDEPSSYLDIRQRMKVSKLIRNFTGDAAILVVEHDLVMLDYIADMICIMHGEEACYGICTNPLAAKAGINTYLSGFLRAENLRFRENEIKFQVKPKERSMSERKLVSWDSITKRMGNFSLEAREGHLSQKQVIGVLGPNGIGKTTFVKILAGAIKQDSGNVDRSVRVSYKPQYLSGNEDVAVSAILKDAIEKYETQLIRPLGLKHLLAKKVKELSGGELQRAAVAECLSKDADVYLLDEPSAFLDVEQRLIVSKVIKERLELSEKAALVVDHDLLFIDYLSDGIMNFSGVPAREGYAEGPFSMEEGMNHFLEELNTTLRRDPESHRPRINKPDSQMDKKQKAEGKLYYA